MHRQVNSQERIPLMESARRVTLEAHICHYAQHESLVPPLMREELMQHAQCIARKLAAPDTEIPYIALFLNNAIWSDVIAGIPFERRLLLLPQCLSKRVSCSATRDNLGLLCAQCGACAIGHLQAEADRLGYVTLVAEGTTVVSKLLTSGKVDAVIGIGCMESLQRIFPIMNEHAIPGQGIPLLSDGCVETAVDLEYAYARLRASSEARRHEFTDLERVAGRIQQWFTQENLDAQMGPATTEAQRIGIAWMMTGGKRWRPLLTAAIFEAAGGDMAQIREAAIGVECFHKASLIHDDIEDNDDERYGEPTIHRRYGVPAAINAGDWLIGEGYRQILQSRFSGEIRAQLVAVAAKGHCALCLGQGEELAFSRSPTPVSEASVLRIYERKTAAAFEVAVLVGAIAAGVDEATCKHLSAFSRAVGTAYQIQDDIEDFRSVSGRAADLLSMRPTLYLAIACSSDNPDVQSALASVWKNSPHGRETLIEQIEKQGLHARVDLLYAHYRHETERILAGIQHTALKRLLRRIMTKMLR